VVGEEQVQEGRLSLSSLAVQSNRGSAGLKTHSAVSSMFSLCPGPMQYPGNTLDTCGMGHFSLPNTQFSEWALPFWDLSDVLVDAMSGLTARGACSGHLAPRLAPRALPCPPLCILHSQHGAFISTGFRCLRLQLSGPSLLFAVPGL
jgi:hypothetical protein